MPYIDFCATIKPTTESADEIAARVEDDYFGPDSRFSGEHYPHHYDSRIEDDHFYFATRDQHSRAFDWGETLAEDGLGEGLLAVVYAVETDHVGYGELYEYDAASGRYELVPEIGDTGPPTYEGEPAQFGTDVVEALAEMRDIDPAYYRSEIRRPADEPFLPRAMRE